MASSQSSFYESLQNVKSLRAGPDCRYQLNAELDSLLLVKYTPPIAPPVEHVEDMLVTCVHLLSLSYAQLVSKMAQLVHRALIRNPVVLSKAGFQAVMAFIETALASEWTAVDGLKALSSLLLRHLHLFSRKHLDLLASTNLAAPGTLFQCLSNRENIGCCCKAALCLGLLAQRIPPSNTPVLSDDLLLCIMQKVVESLQQSVSRLQGNPTEMKLCRSLLQCLLHLWPVVKDQRERNIPSLISCCKALLDSTCGGKDPDKSQAASVASQRQSVASASNASLTTPSSEESAQLAAAGEGHIPRMMHAPVRLPTVSHARRRKRKKKKKETVTTSTLKAGNPGVNESLNLVSDGDEEGENPKSGNLAEQVANSVLTHDPSQPVHSAPVASSRALVASVPDEPLKSDVAGSQSPLRSSMLPADSASEAFAFQPTAMSSDSETSDVEGARSRLHEACMSPEEDLERCALQLLELLISALPRKDDFNYFPVLLPNTAITSRGPLFSIALGSSDRRLRCLALMVAIKLLDGSRPYLNLADDSPTPHGGNWAFTPLSQTLGSTLKEVYKYLLQLLEVPVHKKPCNEVFIQAIKCLSIFLVNAPLHRLRSGYLSGAVGALEPLLIRRDPGVRTACLTCLGAIVTAHAPLEEVTKALEPPCLTVGVVRALQQMAPIRQGVALDRMDSGSDILSSSATDGDGLSDWKVVRHVSSSAAEGMMGAFERDMNIGSQSAGAYTTGKSSAATATSSGASPSSPVSVDGGSAFAWLSFRAHLNDVTGDMLDLPRSASWLCRLARSLLLSKCRTMSASSGPAYRQKEVVRTEALQVLLCIVHNYFPLVRHFWRSLVCLVLEIVGPKSTEAIRLHSVKLLTSILLQVGNSLYPKESAPSVGKLALASTSEFCELWQVILDALLLPLVTNEAAVPCTLRSHVLDCITTVKPETFDAVAPATRELCLDLIRQRCEDNDQMVKIAAIRALGLFLMHPHLRRMATVLESSTAILTVVLADPALSVRAQASWTFGNLVEGIVRNAEDGISADSDYLCRLLSMSVKVCTDHHRCKAGGVRAAGCAIRCLRSEDFGTSSVDTLVNSAMDHLIKIVASSSITAKVRWNACFGITRALGNPALPVATANWAELMFKALLGVAHKHKNFKVRIGGVAAILAPNRRSAFGESPLYLWVCDSIISALENCGTLADYGDLRYKDTLQKMLCIATLHLIGLAAKTDDDALAVLVKEKSDVIRLAIHDCISRAGEAEKSASAATAIDSATTASSQANESEDGDKDTHLDTNSGAVGTVKEAVDGLRVQLIQTQEEGRQQLQSSLEALLLPISSEKPEFPFQADYS